MLVMAKSCKKFKFESRQWSHKQGRTDQSAPIHLTQALAYLLSLWSRRTIGDEESGSSSKNDHTRYRIYYPNLSRLQQPKNSQRQYPGIDKAGARDKRLAENQEPKNELQKNAIALARRKELETYQRALDIQWLNSRMDDSHIGRHLAQINQEAEMERDFQERTDHSALVNARTQKEIALASEIAKHSQEEICQLQRRHYLRERDPELRTLLRKLQNGYVCKDLKQQILHNQYKRLQDELQRRHYLRERDPELRTLLRKLQNGYVCKDLKQQILHNQYKRLQDEAEERRQNMILMSALAIDAEAVKREEEEAMERKAKLLLEMQQQLVDRQRVKQCQFEETLIEKKMLEEVMKTIADEDHRELQQKRELAVKLNKEIEMFKKAREAWKEKQKKLLVIEERNIENQIKQAGDRSTAIVAERERKFREREMLNEKIAAKIIADRAAILEREDIVRSWHNSGDSNLKRCIFKSEADMEVLKQKDLEKERQLKEKKRQYALELKQQMSEDVRRRQQQKQQEEEEAKYVFDTEKAWLWETAEERRRIVSAHAPQVLGYLQPGILRSEDLPLLKHAASQHPHLCHLQLDHISQHNKPLRRPKCNSQCRILREY
ncbi:Meiosis-specific nuclear structural protein 1 [Papilio machaon]|uniref:Meiosis-specific nuclear structural protein 1 n=1 Tax=Papilio machaon TaxID=76193 RepID=A0A194QLV7_PAPMA|nr:Meiosis-specific nuclear structural protein 1 [Papilio machaon]